MGKYLYLEIKEYLTKLIRDNKDIPNYQLPSENQLALKFSTSRITAKRALAELQNEGHIYRIHGKGSFISPAASENEQLMGGNSICMLLPNLESHFITRMVDGVQQVLRQHGYHLLLVSEKEPGMHNGKLISHILELGVKGIIVFPNSRSRYKNDLLLLALNKFPVVFVDRTLRDFDVSAVTSDHIAISQRAVQMLFERGCKQVGFISRPPEYSTSIARRITGYEIAHMENDRTIHLRSRLYLPRDESNQLERILDFLANNPDMDGLLTYGSSVGFNVYRAIQKAGIQVPEQLKVIFFDDEYADFCDLLPFAPTCIVQRSEEIGGKAAQLVLQYIKSKQVTIDKVFVDCDIVERDSTKN
jgi:GntR family transcriptional regulator of arabinose operon